jgi:hypothetical protein
MHIMLLICNGNFSPCTTQIMVNAESLRIFNCSFESSESGKIGKLFVENSLGETRDSALTMAVLTIRAV